MNFHLITTPVQLKECTFTQRYPYHLVLAQFLYNDNEYMKCVKDLIERGGRVVLDNGAYEGAPCPIKDYLDLTLYLKPWCVVLPDLVGASRFDSRKKGQAFLTALAHSKWSNDIMYVPQGKSASEVIEEFEWAAHYMPKDIILGYGKCYTYWGNTESHRMKMFDDTLTRPYMYKRRFWFLGARYENVEYFQWRGYPIIGLDSFKPTSRAYAIQYPTTFDSRKSVSHNEIFVVDSDALEYEVHHFCDLYQIPFPQLLRTETEEETSSD
jgi:hypothetical protein